MAPIWKRITGILEINAAANDDQEDIVDAPESTPGADPKNNNKNKKKKKAKTKAQGTVEGPTWKTGPQAEESLEEKQKRSAELKYSKGLTCYDRTFFSKWLRLVYLLVFCLILGLIIPFILATFAFCPVENNLRGTCSLNISYRFQCYPWVLRPPTEYECHDLGCCYDPSVEGDQYAPICFHSIPSEYGYQVLAPQESPVTAAAATGKTRDSRESGRVLYTLGDNNGELVLSLGPLRDKTTMGTEAWPLTAVIQQKGNDVVRILISSTEDEYFKDDFAKESATDPQLDVVVSENPGGDFNITVTRVATGEEVLETVFGPMIYGQDFAEISVRVPTGDIYGLGLRRNFDFLPNYNKRERWALFNADTERNPIYSSHPFFMNFEKDPSYMFGFHMKTPGPVEVGVLPIPAVVFRGVGTVWDMRVMAGPSPRDVSRQYALLNNAMPAMPPYWALGYHLCRSTNNLTHYDISVEKMEEAEIPYESDCIDALLNYPDAFSPLPEHIVSRVKAIREAGRKFILAQYPFVPYLSEAYNASRKFLLKFNDSSPYYGLIKDVTVGYPDYANENTFKEWLNMTASIKELHDLADGAMLLLNTPSNHAPLNYSAWDDPDGQGCTPTTPGNCCPNATLPFLPSGVVDVNNLTLCSALVHHSLGDAPHLRLHNAYGYYHHLRITQLMKELQKKKRPFVTSQSTHPGSGGVGGAFGSRYGPNFVDQRTSLVEVLEMGLYGVPLAGAPICGSVNGTEDELRTEWCLRGHQMAAFLPLMVSHYEFGHMARNPVDFDKSFTNQLKYYIRQRFMLLPYLYTLLYEASQEATPIARPLFYEFPDDLGSRGVTTQFMLGKGLMMSPVFRSDDIGTDIVIHFPPGCWYEFYTGSLVAEGTNGTDILLPTLLSDVNVHMRGGAILPLQGNLHDPLNTTEDNRGQPLHIVAALNCNATDGNIRATGTLYFDDGKTPLEQNPAATHLEMTATSQWLSVTRLGKPLGAAPDACPSISYSTKINWVKIYGADQGVKTVTVGGTDLDFKQDVDTAALYIPELSYDWCEANPLNITWTYAP